MAVLDTGAMARSSSINKSSASLSRDEAQISALATRAKDLLDVLLRILTMPVPLMLAIAVAGQSVDAAVGAGSPGPGVHPGDASLWGLQFPLAIAVILVMAFNGLLLLHAARLTILLRACWQVSLQAPAVREVLSRHPGLLNPFFKLPSDGDFDQRLLVGMLHLLPKLSVGLLFGFHLIFIVSPWNIAEAWGDLFLPVVWAAAILHVAGNFTASACIAGMAWSMNSWTAVFWLGIGYGAGFFLGYETVIALTTH